jgi:acyl-CoA synthetase (AMP-forming)/AMP-acid ligase II
MPRIGSIPCICSIPCAALRGPPAYDPARAPKEAEMIRSDHLPLFVFVAPDGTEQTLRLGDHTGRVRASAAAIKVALGEDFVTGMPVGLMFPTGPDLLLAWLACVLAGAEPLVMQYPTARQTRAYWEESVRNTVAVTGLRLILADAPSAARDLASMAPVLDAASLAALPAMENTPFEIADFAILQLSSGTTGHRKAMRLSGAALARHVADYNAVLGLGAADVIVSWLPLYHDMGYVACFVMPLLLGIKVVMMDPITWVGSPHLLLDAIETHAGTHCYMPNFGFEVMARQPARALPSMRAWISCSEPVSPATARKFIAHFGLHQQQFAACYAMAENAFAVTFGRGLATRVIDDVEVASCGAPIPGVALKLVEGEIFVRSPASIAHYIGAADMRDADGAYATGDLGVLENGQLFVTGRRQDVLIQAGRKFMLSDIDLALNRLFPDIRGRAAALAMNDPRLGTERPVVLIEAIDFYQRQDTAELAQQALRAATGLEQIEIFYVPPRFLTKTSSGKINRKLSARHWQAVLDRRTRAGAPPLDISAQLRAAFPRMDPARPVSHILDSLSLTVLRIILAEGGLAYDAAASLQDIEARAANRAPPGPAAEGIRIVSLADRQTIARLTERHIDALCARLGCPVTLEHVCLPPSPIILSDLVFTDYLLARLDSSAFSDVEAALDKLRNASLILVDDAAEMRLPPNQAYGVLSHHLERDPRADLITLRWQQYARQHHKLPLTYVAGRDLPLEDRNFALQRLGAYLRKPIFRIAGSAGFAEFTTGWELRAFEHQGGQAAVNPQLLTDALARFILAQAGDVPRVKLPGASKLAMLDLGHFCSHFAHQPSIDKLLAAYSRFCIAGQDSSIPYIRRKLAESGKWFRSVPSYAPEILATITEPYDCLLICGAWGDYPIETPAAAIMFVADTGARCLNITDPELARLNFKRNAKHDPPSAEDWFNPGPLHRNWKIDAWAEERDSIPRQPRQSRTGMREVNRHAASGDARAAYEAALGILRAHPGNLRALAALSRSARQLGQWQQAQDWAEQAINAAPSDPTGHRLRAAALKAQQNANAPPRANPPKT